MLHADVSYRILRAAFALYNSIGPDYRELVYHKGMIVEMNRDLLRFRSEVPVSVIHRGVDIGDYRCDFTVDDRVLVELKAVEQLEKAHFAQLLNYLRVSGMEVGLLINFGRSRVTWRRGVKTADGRTEEAKPEPTRPAGGVSPRLKKPA